MDLQRFESFVRQLEEEHSLMEYGSVTAVYRVTGKQWFDSNHNPVVDETVVSILSDVSANDEHWRGSNDSCAYFPITALGSVVAFTCPTPPWKKTRDKIAKLIEVGLKHSRDAFDAEHDALTGLLNSRSMEALLKRIGSAQSPSEADEPKIPPATGLIALDLDHFKQVNDSFGHDYGDVVLITFAGRITKLLNELRRQHEDMKFFAGRIGGEEFMVVIDGIVSSEVAKNIAERIRTAIGAGILPTEEEWSTLQSGRPTSLELPHESERRVTVSVGLSSLITTSNRSESALLNLRREADAALYRAKAGGRDTVRWFPEIRDRFGTVIEHHSDTDIVVIDIGTHLNVRQGDEFHVYHPDFTGEKPFIFTDGRTKKRLGQYPKLSSGRLVVFQVQPEIAFCKVAEHTVDRFPVGSSLEYIPVGSIAHLITGDFELGSSRGLPLVSLQKLEKAITEARGSSPTNVFVFRLDGLEQLERARGVVFINRVLAGLFESIQEVMPSTAMTGQLQSDTLAVVVQGKMDAPKLADEVLSKTGSRFGGLAKFGAGLYDGTKYEPISGDHSKLDPKRALQLARYAALPAARTEGAVVQRFTPETAYQLLLAQKDARKVREARADYAAFKNVGIVYSEVENQLGLVELIDKNWEAAFLAFDRGAELQPDHGLLAANKAFTQFLLRRKIEAHKGFSSIPAEIELPPAYFRVRALAAFAQYQKDATAIGKEEVIEMLRTSKEKGANVAHYGVQTEDIDQALKILTGQAGAEPALQQ